MVDKVTTVSILGCCASRNIFNVKLGNEYKVSSYIFSYNPLLINQSVSNKYDIPDADIIKLPNPEFKRAYPRRSVRSLINCDAKAILLEKKGEWIIVDTHYSTATAYKLRYPNGEEILLQANYAGFINILIENCSALKGFSIERLLTQINIDDYVDGLCDFLRKNWGRNIILLNTNPSSNRVIGPELSTNGYLAVIRDELKNYEYSQKILSRLDCHYIEIPFPIARDENTVHYTSEVQEYLKLKVDIIINYGNTSPRKYINAINKLDAEYGQKIRKILRCYLDGSVSAGYMGRAYRDGKGVEKDLDKAAEWMRKSADKNVGWAKNELFDILWRIGTPEAHEEMISVAAAFAELGDGNAMGRLGRAYRDGKGVEKDLNKAIEWMRKASEQGLSWAKWELCDLLLSDKTDEGFRETIREIFSNNGAKEYTIHQSLTTNKKIINKYILRTVNGIFDYAWSINDSNLLKQLLLVDTINLNDKNNARVSKIYFDGVITSRSLKKSFQLLSCSITGEVAQAKDYDNLPIDQFFRELPKSVGPLRLLQQTSISLLEELIEICSINGIKYWAVGGTLIGSVRHQGFIPWDDDIDIGILRDDIIKLQKIVKDDYPHLRLSEEYWMYEGPHHVYNLSYRGYESIFRIDIFIFDLCNTENTLWSEMIKSRRQLCMDVKNYLSIKKLNPRVHRIMDQDVINDIDKMIQKNNPNFIGEFREKGVIWAIDNMSLPEKKKRLFDYDSIFPTKQMPFENIMIDVPKDYELFLKLGFGDYYTLPSDIFDHRHNSLSSNDVEKLLNLRSTLDSKNSNSVT